MGMFASKEEKAVKREAKEQEVARQQRIEKLGSERKRLYNLIPLVSIQNPHNWKYKTLDMVATRSTMGTGFWAEGDSFWSDLMGTEDSAQSSKILQGEGLCANRLKEQCVQLGGNAIIGVDIDYSEIGSGNDSVLGNNAKALICMAGTAVIIENAQEVMPKKTLDALDRLSAISEELRNI